MSGLIANGTFSTPDVVINSDPFFPSVSSNHVREVLRLDSSVTNQRLIPAIEAAVIHVNEQLESLKSKGPTLV
ncbi:head completion/stabilization protein, partial [Acinetobacter baumannii]|uniref:head completion/stabilization protein n=1 Tax=Acinetobacter baumannii TaxID=470 RepID=UPI0029C554DC